MLLETTELMRCHLEARDGTVGKIKDLLFDDDSWTVRYFVADTRRWLPGARVLLSPHSLTVAAMDQHKIPVDLLKEQIENAPRAEEDQPVSAQYQRELHDYYGWPAYWTAAGPYPIAGVPPVAVATPPIRPPKTEAEKERERRGDPHLRSAAQVMGYAIAALDGKIGHVTDFLIEDAQTVRGLIVDTRDWLPGKRVAVDPANVDQISWTDSAVSLRLNRETLKQAPEYDPEQPVTVGGPSELGR